MDYNLLIDDETWAFIRKTAEFYPPDTVDMSITDQRHVYDTMCRAFNQGRPEGVSAKDRDYNGVPVRIYDVGESDVVLVYFHGGGFVVGGLDSHDDICAEICARTGFRVVAVDYRLSPEHPHPAGFQDAWDATRYVSAEGPTRLLLCGDSAGANLGAAVAHHARGRIAIAGQVLIYPGLGGDVNTGSYLTHANAPMLTREETIFYMDIRQADRRDPTAAPLCDNGHSNLPRTVTVSAECDPLADDARQYAAAIIAAGGDAHWINESGLVHGYLRARTSVTKARDSFGRIIAALTDLGAGLWPY